MNEFSYVRVKICGITRPGDAVEAARLGVDAVGLVFAPASPRCIDIARARDICRELPPFVSRVGLFMDAGVDRITTVLDQVELDWLQFHGSEDEAECRRYRRPWIKALGLAGSRGEGQDISGAFPGAAALLLDSHAPGSPGGTGRCLDWTQLRPPSRPWILAGGLTPENLGQAIGLVHPPAVDVSSGVEATPGIKDHARMKAFMEASRNGGT